MTLVALPTPAPSPAGAVAAAGSLKEAAREHLALPSPWPSLSRRRRAPPGGARRIAEAEQLAAEAMQLAPRDPAAALGKARRALAATAEFVPTDYVTAGRKGEVVEDEFQAARDAYRQHRAGLYEAVGTVLARQGNALAGEPLPAAHVPARPDPRPRARPRALAQRPRAWARGARHRAARDRRPRGTEARGGGGDRAGRRRGGPAERAGRDRPRAPLARRSARR